MPGIYQLRSLAQCEAIRQAARPGAHVVIIGMGFIGAEVAASLHQMGLDVTAVLPGAAPLATVQGTEVATMLASIHQEHGVHLVTHDQVTGFEGRNRVERVLTAKGARLECDLVVVAIGIQPNVDALSGCAIALDNGILVNAHCQTNVPDIFAAGDVANTLHPLFGRVRVEHYNSVSRRLADEFAGKQSTCIEYQTARSWRNGPATTCSPFSPTWGCTHRHGCRVGEHAHRAKRFSPADSGRAVANTGRRSAAGNPRQSEIAGNPRSVSTGTNIPGKTALHLVGEPKPKQYPVGEPETEQERSRRCEQSLLRRMEGRSACR
jgi:pyruvate/2-oxoglutarate dehydrogenase complex dihydrolipoamide dehydrogenase (E3) component